MWTVTFRDGSVLKGNDVLSSKVFARSNEIVLLEHKTIGNDRLVLDLTNGLFLLVKNGANTALQFYGLPQEQYPQSSLSNVRVIYFIREYVELKLASNGVIASGASQKPQTCFVGIGFQANTADGRNVKRVVAIYPNGDLDIRDN